MTKTRLSQLFALFIILVFIGCSSTSELTENTPPISEASETPMEMPVADVGPTEDWHLLAPNNDPYYGTGVRLAYENLLANKDPKKEVVVAIIDSGTDINHEDLSGNIWVNEDEIADNNIDDDGNGYVDDIHGWNFIGGVDGSHVVDDTFEITRLYAKLSPKYEGVDPNTLSESELTEFEYYQKVKVDFKKERDEVTEIYTNVSGFEQAILASRSIFRVSSLDSLTTEQIQTKSNDSPQISQAKGLVNYMRDNDIKEQDVIDAREQFQSLANFGMNPEFEPRSIVGDDYDDLTNRFYGNNDVSGPRNDHGTHVAGIVGAVRNNDIGVNGIADVKLMIVRTVPNGDERDKDVANAIRYAAENGADIINMSFGKGYSPQKWYVDEAIQFADSLGVLMVHGSGNDGDNIDTTDSFPNKNYVDGGTAINFMNVGASSWENGVSVPADFSNYGKTEVEIFAPGVGIYSTFPGNSYSAQDGTSMASPVLAGVAALIMTYYPDLSATQVKEILMETATKPTVSLVDLPGSIEEPQMVQFSELSISGGIVNAYNALKLAEEISEY